VDPTRQATTVVAATVLPHPPETLAVLAAIVACGACVQTSIGFGAMLVSVTLGSLVLPVGELLPLLVPVAITQTTVVGLQKRHAIVWPLLLRRVLPLMGIGLALAIVFVDGDAPWMKKALGAMILVLAVRELVLGSAPSAPTGFRALVSLVGVMLAGFVHGVFATGGPVLVWALGQQPLDKAAFRATLQVVWFTLNSVLMLTFLAEGRANASTLLGTATLLPTAGLGIACGYWLHDRVDEGRFRTAVWGTLVLASLPLMLR